MSTPDRFIHRLSGRSSFKSRLAVLLFALACGGAFVRAQVAPTLLPYTLSVVAGGGTASPAAGVTCPVSGLKSTDAFGDGCLATEVLLGAPRYVTTDKNGVVYFSDTNNALIRRIDPATGVITTVAGGATTAPSLGTTCGTGVALDYIGNGCSATAVKLSKPVGLAFSPAGDLYFADNGNDDVRRIDQTTGIITNIAGNTSATAFPVFGYKVDNTSATGPVLAATQSYLNFPYGIAFDKAGNLYIADEGNQALSVVNLSAASLTLQGQTIPAGTIAKFAGYGSLAAKTAQSGDCPSFTSTSARGGCYFGSFTEGAAANVSNLDNPYDIAVDSNGIVFAANYFNYNTVRVTPANVISTYAGVQAKTASVITRGVAGSFAIGNTFNVATDAAGNVYSTDVTSGVVYRVDAGTLAMYPVAGGAPSTCATATDASGDGCPASQAILGKRTGTTLATYLPGGAGGLFVDPFSNLFITDTTLNLVRMAASGTSFGAVGANQPTQMVAAHFAAADGPASNPFSITAGSANFTLGAFTCPAANSDGTTDCTVAVTATPGTLGAFTGTLTVKTAKGATANFALSGTFVSSRLTRTTLAFSTGTPCNSSTVGTTTPVTLTATAVTTGNPTGTVQFFANGVALGAPQPVSTKGVATLANTFGNAGSYNITATYSGDTNFNPSTSAVTAITSAAPAFKISASAAQPYCTGGSVASPGCVIPAGETAAYSFDIAQNVYTGNITFACTNLPAYAACQFSPATIVATGCTTTSTVAVSITTQQGSPKQSAIGLPGSGRWQALAILPGILLALLVGIRRRRSPIRFAQTWMALALLLTTCGLVACGKLNTVTATPSGTSIVTITATGSTGTVSTVTVPLTIK